MLSHHAALRYSAGLATIAALGAGCYWPARLAWADYLFHLDTESSVAHAVRLVPADAEYHARLAALEEGAGRSPHAVESALADAVAANPRMGGAWVELGLRAEAAGDLARAEMLLAGAARVDRTYTTLWTLASYYFRHNQREQFWPVARRALRIGDVSAHDPVPLFRLAWKMTTDPDTILDRAIPETGAVQARYLEFLLRENLAPIAEPVTERVVAFGGEADLEAVFGYCDRLIEAGAAGRAIHAWNALCWRTLHGYRPLAPERGISLTNSDFAAAPLAHGFDWRPASVAGVDVERAGLPLRLRISFDGRQPEVCEPLVQCVPLVASRRYRLEYHYQTDGIQAGSGLKWRVTSIAGGQEIASDATDLASEQETAGCVHFTVPPGVSLARLALAYRRTPGTMRIEGRITLSAVSLRFDP